MSAATKGSATFQYNRSAGPQRKAPQVHHVQPSPYGHLPNWSTPPQQFPTFEEYFDLRPPTTLRHVSHVPQQQLPTFDDPHNFDPPVTPLAQIMPPPATPNAPLRQASRKRRLSFINSDEEIDLDTPPSRLLQIINATATYVPPPNPFAPRVPRESPSRPRPSLTKSGIIASTPTKSAIHFHDSADSLVSAAERDPTVLPHLHSLISRGRRTGGCPTYTLRLPATNSADQERVVRFDYCATEDSGGDVTEESQRKRRREGSPLSKNERKSIKAMFFKPCHIPETVDFDA